MDMFFQVPVNLPLPAPFFVHTQFDLLIHKLMLEYKHMVAY
jgi:hypothetical protein